MLKKWLNKLGITSSKGVFRTLASVCAGLALVPQLAPYREILIEAAGWLGSVGVVKAAASK